jgi:hypothetical protein
MTKQLKFTRENHRSVSGYAATEIGLLNIVYEAEGYVCARQAMKSIGVRWRAAKNVIPSMESSGLIDVRRDGEDMYLCKSPTPTSRINLMPERCELRDIRKAYCRNNIHTSKNDDVYSNKLGDT